MFDVRNNNNGKEYRFETIEALSQFISKTYIDFYNEYETLPDIDFIPKDSTGFLYENNRGVGDFTIKQRF